MECPRCQAPLVADANTWRCPQRHGRFVPSKALGDVPKHRLRKASESFPSIACPGCGQGMRLVHPKGMDVDVCACGSVWLDGREERLLREGLTHGPWGVAEIVVWIAAGLGGLG